VILYGRFWVIPEAPTSGLIRCGHCGCSLVGEVKKGRYVYYHCTGYRGKCGEPYTREETLEQQLAAGLRGLVLPPAVLQWLQSELLESDQAERVARTQALRRQQMELERMQARMNVLYEDRLEGRIDAAMYDQKAAEVRERQEQIRRTVREGEGAELGPVCEAVDLMALTDKAAELFLIQPRRDQRKLLKVVLQEATSKGGGLRMSIREPFFQFAPPSARPSRSQDLLPSESGPPASPALT